MLDRSWLEIKLNVSIYRGTPMFIRAPRINRGGYIMSKHFGKTLFGYKPEDVISEIDRIDSDYQQKIDEFKKDIEKGKNEINIALEKQTQLQNQLNAYVEREKMITDVMIKAQMNAQNIEEQARDKARMMLESSEMELRHKLQELDFVRLKVTRFKDEFREVLDNYRVSLENVKEIPDDISFTPTLVVNEKNPESIIK